MSLCLELHRSVPKYLGARAFGGAMPGLLSGALSPLRYVDRKDPELPGDGWVRVSPRLSGICGSDLNTLTGRSSLYFSALVSMPFVLGHEVVGDLLDDVDGPQGRLAAGERVVVDPVLSCAPRGLSPGCGPCRAGEPWLCERVMAGHLRPGLQTGYCNSTGGGWSGMMVAHRSQLHPVPEALPDEAAVMVEPTACAIHAVRRAAVPAGATVLVVGAGTVGLLTTAALARMVPTANVIVGAYTGSGAFPDAMELVAEAELGKLVTEAYPLSKFREAVDHALSAGRLGSVKVVFDPRLDA